MTPLLSPEIAYDRIRASLPKLGTEIVSLDQAFGRVLRQSITADRAVPPFDRAMMDGIAISTKQGHREFSITGIQAAGSPALSLESSDQCFEVMTGAVMPNGCDCVIPIEQVSIENGIAKLAADCSPTTGDFIHFEGSDHHAGDTLVEAGIVIGAPEMAIAASCGATELSVSKLPKVLLITTGDEVVPPSGSPEIFQIRSSHPSAIISTLNSQKLADVTHSHLADDESICRVALKEALETADVIALTGGVSKGKFDYIAPLLRELSGEPKFHGVAQRPGKPLGYFSDKIPVFALPGNPLSVMACMARYLLPALKQMLCMPSGVITLPLAQSAPSHPRLTHLLGGRIENGKLYPASPNNSGDYAAILGCHGVIELQPSTSDADANEHYNFYPWV